MKKIILATFLLTGLFTVRGQISLTADSMVVCKSDVIQQNFIPVNRVAEKFSIEIDKDLMTLRVFGTGHEHALIETAYIINLLDVNSNQDKWMFQGVDKNCVSYTITLDIKAGRIDFITFRNESNGNKTLTMVYYPITSVAIDKEAITRHLEEKKRNLY